jgi:Bacterial SH3 domain
MPQFKVTASGLNVRETPSLQGRVIGSLSKDDIVEKIDVSSDQKWLKVQKDSILGWSSQRFLIDNASIGQFDQIVQITNSSAITTFNWLNRGVAPRGYIKGMALAYARVYCKLLNNDAHAAEMAKADTGMPSDALTHYAAKFGALGLDNDTSGSDTLRHLFILLLGLGMRESSGRWCEGRDLSATNITAETAEAGLFQTSWNAHSGSPLLPKLINDYKAKPNGFLDVFEEGVTPRANDLQNFGTGDGEKFQKLSKECPAFAVEFAAIGLRNFRTHWGPITRREAELRPEADHMFLQVQQAVDSKKLCPLVL